MERTIVRSECGHLYSTIWIPAVSFKAIRMANRRYQRCPICHHWRWVEPVDASQLSPAELDQARSAVDSPIP